MDLFQSDLREMKAAVLPGGAVSMAATVLVLVSLVGVAAVGQELPFRERPSESPAAKKPPTSLESAFVVESALHESATERYLSARRDEEAAWQVLREATGELDRAMASSDFGVEELRLLDLQVSELRERALLASRQAGDLRRELLTTLERVAAMGAALEQQRERPVVTDRFSGTWEIEIAQPEESGIFVVELQGTLLTGRYVFGSGSKGSLVGSLVGGQVRLERIDDETGRDMTYEGLWDPGSDTIEGQWSRRELAVGLSAGGDFVARKLTDSEVEELEEQPTPLGTETADEDAAEETSEPPPW